MKNIVYSIYISLAFKSINSLALFDICNQLVNAIEGNQLLGCLFLDYAMAFDTVNHEI